MDNSIKPLREELKEKLSGFITGSTAGLSESQFNETALQLFHYQYQAIPSYRNLCLYRQQTPETVSHYNQIPPVPTTIYKHRSLFAGDPGDVAHTFMTSGTSKKGKRGQSLFSSSGLELMACAIETNARHMLFPDTPFIHIYVLAPPPERAPHMIMSWGMNRIIKTFGSPQSGFLFDEQGLNHSLLTDRLAEAVVSGEKVALIGASFGFVHLLEYFDKEGIAFQLPEGSRIMDAGGYKGRSRQLNREELETLIFKRLGIPSYYAVNLLGMTEMASQVYDDTLAATVAGLIPSRLKQNPPWTRSRVLDPFTLQAVPNGEEGVLCHWDLANLDIPLCVLTDDLGIMADASRGFQIKGRVSSDYSRGCSLSIEELVSAGTLPPDEEPAVPR